MKWARVLNGIVDVISFDPDRIWVDDVYEVQADPENPGEEIETLVTPGHWNGVTPDWVEVADDVYGGHILNADGTFSAPPPPPLPPPTPYTLQMADFWARFANDDEYDEFDGALSTALPAKDRRAFNAATSLRSDAPLFSWVRTILLGVVGEGRASAIMAESPAYGRPASDEIAS